MTPPSKVLGLDSFKGMGIDCADLNGDGLPDLFVSNITSQYSFEESNFVFLSTGQLNAMQGGVAPYVDSCESLGLCRSGWAWDVKMADFNNMGALQIIQAEGFVKSTVNRWPELQELGTGNEALVHDPRFYPVLQQDADIGGHDRANLCLLAVVCLIADDAVELRRVRDDLMDREHRVRRRQDQIAKTARAKRLGGTELHRLVPAAAGIQVRVSRLFSRTLP